MIKDLSDARICREIDDLLMFKIDFYSKLDIRNLASAVRFFAFTFATSDELYHLK